MRNSQHDATSADAGTDAQSKQLEISLTQREGFAAEASPEPLTGTSQPIDWRTIKSLRMIEADPSTPLHALAMNCQVSHAYLRRLFRRATGHGLKETVIDTRLQKAVLLLTRTPMGIKEIAAAAGYAHNSSFTRAFAKHFGCGPRQYRMDNALHKVLEHSSEE